MAISQSDTQWNPAVKNAAGKVIKKGYLSEKGKPKKRVTAAVKMVVDTQGRKAGETQKYSSGRRVSTKPARNVNRGGSAPTSSSSNTSTTKPATVTSSTTTTKGKPAAFPLTDPNKRNTYQTGRGQTAMQNAARKRQDALARKRRGTTSGTVSSAKKQQKPSSDNRIWGPLNPFGLINKLNEERTDKRDTYGTPKPKTATSVKQSTTYYANGNARVWDPKLKKMITVSPNDRRHPKGKK